MPWKLPPARPGRCDAAKLDGPGSFVAQTLVAPRQRMRHPARLKLRCLDQRRQNQSRRQCRSTMPSNGARSRRSRQLVGTAPWNTSPIRIGARQSDWLFRSDVAQVPVAGCLRGAACLLGFDTERRAARAAAARDGVARVTDLRAAATVFAALIDQRRTTSAESPRFHPEPTSQRAGKTTR